MYIHVTIHCISFEQNNSKLPADSDGHVVIENAVLETFTDA